MHPDNTDADDLVLQTVGKVSIEASVSWFYGTVALTCLLLINLVLLSGVTIYWILEHRQVKRQYEQFRLTESDHDHAQIKDQ